MSKQTAIFFTKKNKAKYLSIRFSSFTSTLHFKFKCYCYRILALPFANICNTYATNLMIAGIIIFLLLLSGSSV